MNIKKLVSASICLALAMVLPFLTGQIPQIGSALSPMHIPILICGFICGWRYGMLVGFIAPILRFFLFGMPPIFPIGIAMAFELAVYGMAAGLIYNTLKKTNKNIYITLISSMFIGRIMWGLTRFIIAKLFSLDFTFKVFLSGAFISAVPGIVLHILLIPPVIIALKKSGIMKNEQI